MQDNIRIVLVATSHPGNIGAVARAMKTMGFNQLVLVNPKNFPHAEATARAAGADDILKNALVVDSLKDALKNCSLVLGTSARLRTIQQQLLNPKAAAEKVVIEAKDHQVAMVFGRENNGLSNEELECCHFHIHIPTEASFSSLNLGAAVQILCYEIKMQSSPAGKTAIVNEPLASAQELANFYQHLNEVLIAIKFIDPNNPRKLLPRIKRMFNRIRPEKNEVSILRGILSAIQNSIK